MNTLKLIAIIPGGVKDCRLLYDDGSTLKLSCSVEHYMDTLSAMTGGDNGICRRLFPMKKGTGLRMGDGTTYVELRLAVDPPIYGYVLLSAIEKIFPRKDGKCTLYLSGGLTLPTFWRIQTVAAHMQMVEKVLGNKETKAE